MNEELTFGQDQDDSADIDLQGYFWMLGAQAALHYEEMQRHQAAYDEEEDNDAVATLHYCEMLHHQQEYDRYRQEQDELVAEHPDTSFRVFNMVLIDQMVSPDVRPRFIDRVDDER